MTRQEITGKRDLFFSNWIRNNLPNSSTGFLVSDLDFFIFNYKKKLCMLLEVKTHNSTLKTWQKIMYENLSRWIEKGADDGWIFGGYHIITFENTNFKDGRCYYNHSLITEEQLIKKLSL